MTDQAPDDQASSRARSPGKSRRAAEKPATGSGGSGAASLAGTLWFGGWLFTIGFGSLLWWQALLALVIWPYYLGAALR
jgi:hypothetical protein